MLRTPIYAHRENSSGEVNFDYLPRRGGIGKIKKRRWKYGAGAGLLKKEGAETFDFFKVYHFYI